MKRTVETSQVQRPVGASATAAGNGQRPGLPRANGPSAQPVQSGIIDRETSWLRFQHRVLQEAADPSVPLFERLFFCGIFSSNLDEYFRVRVASLRTLLRLGRADTKKLGISPARLLHDVHRLVLDQQQQYGVLLRAILAQLADAGIHLVDEATVHADHGPFLRRKFSEDIRPLLEPVFLEDDGGDVPFLRNRHVYLAVELWESGEATPKSWIPRCALVEVPPALPRFITLPERGNGHEVMFIDDLIRYNLAEIFPNHEVQRAYAVKLTRDAELHIEDEFEGDLVEAIRKCLKNRETGVPCRFLYDMNAPYVLVRRLQKQLELSDEDLVPGSRYHNLSDLMGFPRFGRTDLSYPDWPALPHPVLSEARSLFDAVRRSDQVVHTPYQSFEHVVRFLDEAAEDPTVEEVWLTVYRVARDSSVLAALIRAAELGKRVTVFFEVQARFDEESNLDWADRLEAAGARTLYSMPGLKVHAKIAMVARREDGERALYAYVGTGNFNEKTARVYVDHGIFTRDTRITRDIEQVLLFLAGEVEEPVTEHVLVAPFSLRKGFYRLIDEEIEHARSGGQAAMTLKMNALEDSDIIDRLFRAAAAGVPVDIMVRGICRVIPGTPERSETIRIRSILDRCLEHARIYRFHHGGEDRMYLASADWMKRNLSHRVEVAVPVYDPAIRAQLTRLLEIQLADNRKARMIDASGFNPYVHHGEPPVRAQEAFRDYVATLAATPGRQASAGARKAGRP